ncbi:MAG TPA: hypothetical protein PLK35_03155 [Candidatus Moranbacteria bacterium]|nr:hypothetical protein [Candidatus Moranbacteria bacterium]
MFEEIPKEQFSEKPKDCLIGKLDKMYNYFSSEKLAYDEKFLENLKKVIETIEKLRPEQIAASNHMGHIIGQLETGFGYAGRIKKIPEIKDIEKIPGKEMRQKYRETFLQSKNSLKNYIEMCVNNPDFINAEISFSDGYWEDKRTDDNKSEIAELNAYQFVKVSRDKFEKNKEMKEAA